MSLKNFLAVAGSGALFGGLIFATVWFTAFVIAWYVARDKGKDGDPYETNLRRIIEIVVLSIVSGCLVGGLLV